MKVIVHLGSLRTPLTGIGRYSLNLLKELLQSKDVEDLVGFDHSGFRNRDEIAKLISSIEDVGQTSNEVVRGGSVIWLRRMIANIPGARRCYQYLKQLKLDRQKERLEGYVYWEPNYLLSEYDGASVTTIHDLSHIHFPEMHPKERISEMARRLPFTLLKSTRLQAVSEFTKSEIVSLISPLQSVDIVSPGVGEEFFNISEPKIIDVIEQFSLPSTFILSVATFEPRKNLVRLIRAFDKLPEETKCKFPLVMVGAKGWGDSEAKQLLKNLISKNQVVVLGYVPQDSLPALYAAASLFVYVSVYEGFGMPIAESMAAGTPVITSNITSMPEVAGGAAVLVDPYSELDITNAMIEVLNDDELRSRMIQQGQARARSYTWQNSGRDLIKSLMQALEVAS